MRRNVKRPLLLLSVSCLLALPGRASESELSETNLIAESTKLWTESMLWDEQTKLSSGIGYNDNVLLSAFHARGSAFVINGLDFMAIRTPLDGWQVVAAILGDDTRYWHNVGASGEDLFIGSLRVQRDLPGAWQAGVEARGLFENQVLDITTANGAPTTALVKGYAISALPSLRKDLFAGLWLKLEMPVTRWYFQAPLDDYWEFGPVVTAGYDFGKRSDISMSYGASYQPHDDWLTLDAFGLPPRTKTGTLLPPDHLMILQHQAELAWHQYWDTRRRWRSSTRLVFAYKEDNYSGYFNYYQYQAVEELRWQTADWEIKGGGQLAYEDYPVQRTGTITSPTLYRTLWELSFDVERRWFKGLWSYAKLDYKRAISNEAGNADNYRGTTVAGGFRWEF